MSATDFLTSFMSAAATPIVKPVDWPKSIAADHPLRSLPLCLRFWPTSVSLWLQAKIDSSVKGWFQESFWTVVAAGICRPDGSPAFADKWPEVWADHVAATNASIGTYDDNNVLSIPPIDYFILGEWLKKTFDNPQGLTIFDPLMKQSFDYNGWVLGEGKNSEKTDTSVPSGEKPAVEA